MRDFVVRRRLIYRITLWVILIISLLVLARLAPTIAKPQYYPTDDFFPYWAAGKLNLSGENPYDPQKKDSLLVDLGGQASSTYPIAIMLNPPWAVSIVMPFSLLNYPLSRVAWLLVSIGLIILCAQLCWGFYHGPPNKFWFAWVIVILFGPTISVLEVGQISSLLLSGITGFLYFAEFRKNDWAAGAALALVAIKPQVILVFWLALLFWVIYQRRWIILISCAATIVLLTLIAMIFNPHIISQYLTMVKTGYITELATPTIGAYLRYFWLGTDKFWLQFVAPAVGGLWFLYYWRIHQASWKWIDTLPILLLVSQVSAPYTYTYDQVILLPAILQAVIWLVRDWKRWLNLILLGAFLLINILDVTLHTKLSDFWFIWMAPALFIWYWLAHRFRSSSLATESQ